MRRLFSEVPAYLGTAFSGVSAILLGHVAFEILKNQSLRNTLGLGIFASLFVAVLYYMYVNRRSLMLQKQYEIRCAALNEPSRSYALNGKLIEDVMFLDEMRHIGEPSNRYRHMRAMLVPDALVPEFRQRIAEYLAKSNDA